MNHVKSVEEEKDEKVPHFRKVYDQNKSNRDIELQKAQFPTDSFDIAPMSFDEEIKAPIGIIIILITSFLLSFILIIIGSLVYDQKKDTKNAIGIWVLSFLVMLPGFFSIYKIIMIYGPNSQPDRVNILPQ